jgi:hypothetical protein
LLDRDAGEGIGTFPYWFEWLYRLKIKSLFQKSRPHHEEPQSGVSKDDFSALWGALVLRDGLAGLLRMRADSGAMAFKTGSNAASGECQILAAEGPKERL